LLGEKKMISALATAIEYLWPLTYFVGLFVTVKYFHTYAKSVFILLILYFALGIFSSVAMPYINNIYYLYNSDDKMVQLLARFELFQVELDKLHLKYPDIEPGTIVKRVSFPLAQILLVTALYLHGARSKREDTQPAPPEGRGEAPRP